MIELNKRKQAEIRRFLGWLQAETGANVDDLSGKTIIRSYLGDYQKDEPETPFDDFYKTLNKSANRKHFTVPPAQLRDQIRRKYESSLNTLRPIKGQLATTDRLIDRIVYHLYGLTNDEIAIVEGRT